MLPSLLGFHTQVLQASSADFFFLNFPLKNKARRVKRGYLIRERSKIKASRDDQLLMRIVWFLDDIH